MWPSLIKNSISTAYPLPNDCQVFWRPQRGELSLNVKENKEIHSVRAMRLRGSKEESRKALLQQFEMDDEGWHTDSASGTLDLVQTLWLMWNDSRKRQIVSI